MLCFCFFITCAPLQASKADFLGSILKHSDDVVKLGKKSANITKRQLDDVIKRFPALAGKSKDMIQGAAAIEQAAKKVPEAARMIEGGINPARVARVAELHPERIRLGNEIAEGFAAGKFTRAADVSPQAAAAVKNLEGNYAKAGENFLEMARRGGKKAVEVAGKLYEAATPGKVGAGIAATLLAWHMMDPQGAEEAVRDFFENHVSPMVAAPAKGLAEGAGKAVDETLDTISEQGANILATHWKLLSIVGFFLLFLAVPNLRRLPLELIDKFCGTLLTKIRTSQKAGGSGEQPRERQRQKPTQAERINIYSRKRG